MNVLTTQAAGVSRPVVGGGVLQHHDAGAVVPLDVDPPGGLDQVHAARVVHVQRLAGRTAAWPGGSSPTPLDTHTHRLSLDKA